MEFNGNVNTARNDEVVVGFVRALLPENSDLFELDSYPNHVDGDLLSRHQPIPDDAEASPSSKVAILFLVRG
jgi:hypothetical protein